MRRMFVQGSKTGSVMASNMMIAVISGSNDQYDNHDQCQCKPKPMLFNELTTPCRLTLTRLGAAVHQ